MSLKKIITKEDLALTGVGACVGLLGVAIISSGISFIETPLNDSSLQLITWKNIKDMVPYGVLIGSGLGFLLSKYSQYKENKDSQQYK